MILHKGSAGESREKLRLEEEERELMMALVDKAVGCSWKPR